MGSLPVDVPLDFGSIQKHISPIGRKVSLPPGLEGLERVKPALDPTVLPLSDFVPDLVHRRQDSLLRDVQPPAPALLERWSSAPPSLSQTSPSIRSPWPPARDEPMYVRLEENTDDAGECIVNKREIRGSVDQDVSLDSNGDVDVYREVPFAGYPMIDTAPNVGLPPAPGYHGLGVPAAPPFSPEYYMGYPCAGAEDPTWPLWQQGMGPIVGVDGMSGVEMRWGAPCAAAAVGELPWSYAPYAAAHSSKTQSPAFKALNGSTSAADDGEIQPTQTAHRGAQETDESTRRPAEEAQDDSSIKPGGLSRMPSVRPNTLEVEGRRICWWPDCKKLEVRGQKHIVSPALHFDAEGKALMLADDGTIENLPADGESKCVKFIIMIQAKKVAPGRGGESFVKAKGRARFEVKCEEPCTATFLLSVGGTRSEGEEGAPRGDEPKGTETPVTHDFGETPVYVFQDEWDLQPLKANLVVSLEIQALQR
mmetsp:Transcript_50316/g.93021  ORF Transcript_50316/g.93021 Transcript_50316/m.93021 type:complete len:479 (-) Transcript_50316:124-1560(-)